MTNKVEYLCQEIDFKKRVLKATNRAAESSKNHESLMMIFINQAERIEDEMAVLTNQLEIEVKSLKEKKNVKNSKKRFKSR